jgi:hypothetical protein
LRGAVFGGNGQTPPVARVMCAQHEYMRRYASHARHCIDSVLLFNRQVRDAWSWHDALQGRYVNTTSA